MTTPFSPHLEVLPEAQRLLWDELGQVPPEFVLYGGTALALHLGHRISVDFDFFTDHGFDPAVLRRRIPFLKDATVIQQEPNTLTCSVDRGGDIKVSFFGLPDLVMLEDPVVAKENGLRIASRLDLAGTKVELVQRRAQAKDYLDIDALISADIDLPTALSAARAIHGDGFQPTPSLKALCYFGDGDLGGLPADVRERLAVAAAKVDPRRLPSLKRNRKSKGKS